MVKAKKQYGFSVSAVYILLVFLSVICIIIGCSSKKDETNAEKSGTAKTRGNIPSVNRVAQEPKSPILTLPDANQTVKKTDESHKARVPTDALQKEFNTTSSSERKIELFKFLPDKAFDHDPCVVALVQTAVADNDGNVVLAAVESLQGCESPEVLPVVAKAMTHPSEEVRRTAVGLLSDINAPQTGDLLATALSDESEDIRDAAFDITRFKDEQIQFKVLEKGISSPYGDTKEESVAMLENMGGHRAVDILIEALQDKDAEFREKVASSISMLIDKEFNSYEEAKTWWEQNRDKYDEDLSLKE
ncbi:MAG: HEAT repeat domain-containing protein [Sedimentisphaerales bacterium]|jgi:HEAT repeat protein